MNYVRKFLRVISFTGQSPCGPCIQEKMLRSTRFYATCSSGCCRCTFLSRTICIQMKGKQICLKGVSRPDIGCKSNLKSVSSAFVLRSRRIYMFVFVGETMGIFKSLLPAGRKVKWQGTS